MIVAIMQPYFFPYLGYFQLMRAADRFVFYDDAQFMKGGWINRNRILLDDAPAWWTYPVVREDYRLPILARRYAPGAETRDALLRKVAHAYRRAPYVDEILPWLRDWFAGESGSVAEFNARHLEDIAGRLGIDVRLSRASELGLGDDLHGPERVLAMCARLGATHYINAAGGRALYDADTFREAGLGLSFLESLPTDYPQFGATHVPFLSIVDALMFLSWQGTAALLDRCRSQTVA